MEATRIFTKSVSFGSVGSLISLPCHISHAAIPDEVRHQNALPPDLIRIAVGIEDAADLIADLEGALGTIPARETVGDGCTSLTS